MIVERFPELTKLPIDEKRRLVDELCAEISSEYKDAPDPRIVKILEERWRAHQNDPSGAITIEEFRKRIGNL
ncbi:MAG: addiction module protein [Verrucomicrobiota bacterium]